MHEKFSKYGPIESIEILPSNNEGYVTFVENVDAYTAYSDHIDDSDVLIAHTWNQRKPKQVRNIFVHIFYVIWTFIQAFIFRTEPPPMLTLNDDCLEAVFDRLDNQSLVKLSETCTRFNDLLKYKYYYPKIVKVFKITLGNGPNALLPAAARKELQLMGRHYTSVSFSMKRSGGMCHFDSLVCWYLKTTAKYCTNIRTAYIDTDTFKPQHISMFAPIFQNLHSLYLQEDYLQFLRNIDLAQICPQLKTFSSKHGLSEKTLLKPFPTLQTLILKGYVRLNDAYLKFFSSNPQLKYVSFYYNSIKNDLATVVRSLPNIDQLSIKFDDNQPIILDLENFKKLTKLALFGADLDTLTEITGVDNLRALKMTFNKFPQPKNDQLIRFIRNLQSLERIDLEKVGLRELHIAELVRCMPNLKSLHIHGSSYVFASTILVMHVVTARKSAQQDAKSRKPIQPLVMYVDAKDHNDISALNVKDHHQYLKIKWNC